MGKKQEKDLRLVQSVVDSVIAERDAEIARLGTEVEDMVGQIAYLNRQLNEASQIVRAGEAERKALRQQVAELQAQNAELRYQIESYEIGDEEGKFDV